MDIEYIKKLVQILEESQVCKLSIEEKNGVKIALEKAPKTVEHQSTSHFEPQRKEMPAILHTPELQPKKLDAIDLSKCVKSPMVGTFYHSETPEAKPFVQVGDEVEVGDTLCIIEAMKVMNEIKSDRKGTVKEILVKNGRPVEYGQPLFTL